MQMNSRWMDEERELRYRHEKLRRVRITIMASPALAGICIFIYLSLMPISGSQRYVLTVVALVALASSGFGLLMIYLQTGFLRRMTTDPYVFRYDNELAEIRHRLQRLDSIDDLRLHQIQAAIETLKTELQELQASTGQLSDQQTEQLFVALRNRFADEQAQQLLSNIESSIREQVAKDLRAKAISAQTDTTLRRLRTEIAALSRRGNLNLVLGIATTLAGLAVLGYYVFYSQVGGSDPWAFSLHFLPRLTLVVFVEIFAYFFLKLYKAGLAEIKYFQNEMTNIESRFAALLTAVLSNYDDATKDALAALTRTERNAVLKKGETTVDLEKAKMERETISDIGKEFLAALKKK